SGFLPDGTPINQRCFVSRMAHWPLFVKLYQGRGSLLGLMDFGAETEKQLAGRVTWIRAAPSPPPPDEIAATFNVIGSPYSRPARTNALLSFEKMMLVFSPPGPSGSFTNTLILDAKGKVRDTSTGSLKLTFLPSVGFFRGTTQDPLSGN